ncbi:MAG: hypothetical protein HC799_16215 [Limnothrix sp. RL_2_0]|nr:hypothetical protein [Limnothrix sp. RL_2_0]
MEELSLFDLAQYEQPTPAIAPDGDGDYEDPAYITPKIGSIDGGKTAALRYLYSKLSIGGIHPTAIAVNCDISKYRAEGLAATDGHLFESIQAEGYFCIGLTECGKNVAKLVVEHLPPDAQLLGEKLGYTYINLRWTAFGGAQEQTFKLLPDKRKHGDGWAYIETRVLRGKYPQYYLHYQHPGEAKRSKYVPKSKLDKVNKMVTEKQTIDSILSILSAKEKGV